MGSNPTIHPIKIPLAIARGIFLQQNIKRRKAMKIGLYTDSHYSSQEVTCGCRYNSRSLDKIRVAYDFFERSGCDFFEDNIHLTHRGKESIIKALSYWSV